MKKTVGVIGCGAIGGVIVDYLANGKMKQLGLKRLFDTDEERLAKLVKKYGLKKSAGIADVVENCDLVVECAHVSVIRQALELCIKNKKKLFLYYIHILL